MRSRTHRWTLLAVVLALLLTFGAAACGDEDEHEGHDMGSAGGSTAQQAGDAERGFLEAMVPHHESAIEMAEAVLPKTDDPELEKLAQTIVDAQEREIEEMNDFRTEKYGEPVPEDGGSADGDLGMEGH